ncbi:hypothetical protein ON010_g17578 [Phytophthora cinnamomi]|nr:hypothetical protein ON010_g17578 [Phytophthora cinnamomi]
MVRPFSNCVETLCTTAALAYWPWKFLEDGVTKKKIDDAAAVNYSNRTLALAFAALGVLFRPTNAIIWLYPGIVHFFQTHDRAHLIFGVVLPIALVTSLAMLCIDRLGYGEWTFVPFNFFKFNVLEGKDKLYGEHPWSWYFSQGYPAIVGTTLPIVIAGNRERAEGSDSQQLERDPRHFLSNLYHLSPSDNQASDPSSMKLPTFVVTYSTIAAKIKPLLAATHYVDDASFVHSDVSGDADSDEVNGYRGEEASGTCLVVVGAPTARDSVPEAILGTDHRKHLIERGADLSSHDDMLLVAVSSRWFVDLLVGWVLRSAAVDVVRPDG